MKSSDASASAGSPNSTLLPYWALAPGPATCVGNVHVDKWENGGGHLSVNLLARPLGVLELRGSNLPIWADMLPDIPEDEYDARAEVVRAALA